MYYYMQFFSFAISITYVLCGISYKYYDDVQPANRQKNMLMVKYYIINTLKYRLFYNLNKYSFYFSKKIL